MSLKKNKIIVYQNTNFKNPQVFDSVTFFYWLFCKNLNGFPNCIYPFIKVITNIILLNGGIIEHVIIVIFHYFIYYISNFFPFIYQNVF